MNYKLFVKIILGIVLITIFITIVGKFFLKKDSDTIPDNFVNVQEFIPSIQIDLVLATNYNFIGKIIDGYSENSKCYLTRQAAQSIKAVQDKLVPMGLSLKLYDCYRPKKALDDFEKWLKTDDNSMKDIFFTDVEKKNMIMSPQSSGHNRGSSVSLTLVPLESKDIHIKNGFKRASCIDNYEDRQVDDSLDMGTNYMCFSPKISLDNLNIPPQARANRLLLNTLMESAGFTSTNKNWWYYTLRNEPYKNIYFDFNI
jgi:D-alanyl-D-alanine dipeptidase